MSRKKGYRTMRGASVVEALFGIFIFTIAFYALYGILTYSLTLVGQNKARLGAVALVDEQVEYLRSLPFASVGVVAGNPSGVLPETESITINGIQYTRRNVVFWVDDPADGTAVLGTDPISTDYKRAKVEVSWNFRGTSRSFSTVTNITPKGLETNVPGGIFKITVADAATAPVSGAQINIKNTGLGLDVDRITDSTGIWYEYGLTPGTGYQITVTKAGYSTSRTYTTAEVANPDPSDLTSIDDNINAKTFFIDRLSSNTAYIFSPPTASTWTDTFTDSLKIQSMSSTTVSGGNLILSQTGPDYNSPGYATSTWVSPANLYQWTQFSWIDTPPAGTVLRYQIYSDVGGGVPGLVPDADLPGNSSGFLASPVDLSGLNTGGVYGVTNYPKLLIAVTATTGDTSVTPSVNSWTFTYTTHVPRANFTFNMTGAKNIGTDAGGASVYKYNKNLTTDASGVMSTSSLEWDTYTISKGGYDVTESCTAQPQYVAPNTNPAIYIDMTTATPEAILVRAETSLGADIPGALVRLYRGAPGAFDQTKKAGLRCGQAFWGGLSSGTVAGGNSYSIDVSAPPYVSTTTLTNIEITGGYTKFTATAN